MKPWLKYSLWVVFIAGIGIAFSFVNKSQEKRVVGLPEVDIKDMEDMLFLTEEEVIQRLRFKNLVGEEKTYKEMDLRKIEEFMVDMPEVKEVEVYTYISGNWKIELELREPIARIFNADGSTCYLDKDGTLMPWSPNYTAHVVAVCGNINETDFSKNVDDIINNDSLITIEILDDLYSITTYVCSDEFLSAQITQIYVNEYNEFELIPRVGDQRILFGDAEHVTGKFKKLEYFYSEGISRAGWENYDTINLMYKSQVVCSKRN